MTVRPRLWVATLIVSEPLLRRGNSRAVVLLNFGPQARHDFRLLRGQVVVLARVVAHVEQQYALSAEQGYIVAGVERISGVEWAGRASAPPCVCKAPTRVAKQQLHVTDADGGVRGLRAVAMLITAKGWVARQLGLACATSACVSACTLVATGGVLVLRALLG